MPRLDRRTFQYALIHALADPQQAERDRDHLIDFELPAKGTPVPAALRAQAIEWTEELLDHGILLRSRPPAAAPTACLLHLELTGSEAAARVRRLGRAPDLGAFGRFLLISVATAVLILLFALFSWFVPRDFLGQWGSTTATAAALLGGSFWRVRETGSIRNALADRFTLWVAFGVLVLVVALLGVGYLLPIEVVAPPGSTVVVDGRVRTESPDGPFTRRPTSERNQQDREPRSQHPIPVRTKLHLAWSDHQVQVSKRWYVNAATPTETMVSAQSHWPWARRSYSHLLAIVHMGVDSREAQPGPERQALETTRGLMRCAYVLMSHLGLDAEEGDRLLPIRLYPDPHGSLNVIGHLQDDGDGTYLMVPLLRQAEVKGVAPEVKRLSSIALPNPKDKAGLRAALSQLRDDVLRELDLDLVGEAVKRWDEFAEQAILDRFPEASTLTAPPTSPKDPFAQGVLNLAVAQLGTEEDPRGSNSGPKVKAYLDAAGLPDRQPWCTAFVYWCLSETAKSMNRTLVLPQTGTNRLLLSRMSDRQTRDPRPGDIYLTQVPGGRLPMSGIVESVNGSSFTGVEGNSNDDGNREAYKVARRIRSTRQAIFLRIEAAKELMPAKGQ